MGWWGPSAAVFVPDAYAGDMGRTATGLLRRWVPPTPWASWSVSAAPAWSASPTTGMPVSPRAWRRPPASGRRGQWGPRGDRPRFRAALGGPAVAAGAEGLALVAGHAVGPSRHTSSGGPLHPPLLGSAGDPAPTPVAEPPSGRCCWPRPDSASPRGGPARPSARAPAARAPLVELGPRQHAGVGGRDAPGLPRGGPRRPRAAGLAGGARGRRHPAGHGAASA